MRAQILYFIAENLSYRAKEFEARLKSLTWASARAAAREVALSVERLFSYAAWADKFEGRVHSPPMRGVALAMNEPVGIIGIACPDDAPLLGFVSLMAPAIAMGNRVVMLPSQRYPLLATDFYQVLETSDLPGGVVNIVTWAAFIWVTPTIGVARPLSFKMGAVMERSPHGGFGRDR